MARFIRTSYPMPPTTGAPSSCRSHLKPTCCAKGIMGFIGASRQWQRLSGSFYKIFKALRQVCNDNPIEYFLW